MQNRKIERKLLPGLDLPDFVVSVIISWITVSEVIRVTSDVTMVNSIIVDVVNWIDSTNIAGKGTSDHCKEKYANLKY